MQEKKVNQAVLDFLRQAGAKGGHSRASKFSKEQIMAWGKKGSEKRWAKKK